VELEQQTKKTKHKMLEFFFGKRKGKKAIIYKQELLVIKRELSKPLQDCTNLTNLRVIGVASYKAI
jgi:hypothetical protein